jgi:putative DNA primase/helicase
LRRAELGDRFAAHPQGARGDERHDQLGNFQTALLGRITPASTPVTAAFSRDEPIDDPEPAVLSLTASYDNARAFAQRRCWKAGSLGVYAWREKFWEWNGRVYQEVPEADLRATIYDFLDKSARSVKIEGGGFQPGRFRPQGKHANELLGALRAGLTLPSECDPPTWLDTGRHAGEVMIFQNGMLDLTALTLAEPTPKLWAHGEVGYEWRPEAKCPEWDAFLESIFPGDEEAKECTEEGLGLSMTEDVSFQKGMLLFGEPRSGKGTIIKVAEALVGSTAYTSLDLDQWLRGEHSRMPLIGKKVVAFPEVRLKPPKGYGQHFDAGGVDYASAQLLLKITSGDGVTIPRKYLPPWEGQLPGKVWMALTKSQTSTTRCCQRGS